MVPDSVSMHIVWLASQLKYQCIPQPRTFTIPASPVNKNKLKYLTSHKTLMICHNVAPNRHVLAFLEFLVSAVSLANHVKSASKAYL